MIFFHIIVIFIALEIAIVGIIRRVNDIKLNFLMIQCLSGLSYFISTRMYTSSCFQ